MAYQFADFFKSYDDDDAARAAEEALVAECGGGKWSDDVFTADAVALYKDPYAPPRGGIDVLSMMCAPRFKPCH